jgi:membrane associated rhomboid family serine protease
MPETCYRHPDRETAVSCSSCGRPICPDCMTPTPVGMRCPECASHRTRVTTGTSAFGRSRAAPATVVLIALNVVFFLAEVATGGGGFTTSGSVINHFALRGNAVADGEWYRIVTGGFLHAGILHIAFNMFALWVLGNLLEPAIGTPRFVALYIASLLAGSAGALLLTSGAENTVGASGAIFGIFGAAFVIARGRGLDAIASEIGLLLLINLALTFGIPGISIGGHLGGLIGGALCALLIVAGDRGLLGRRRVAAELVGMAAIGVIAVVVGLLVV